MRIDGFHHFALSVPDIDKAVDWYGNVLGFTLERQWEISAASARVAYLVRNGMRLEFFEVDGAVAMSPERSDPRADLRTHGHKHLSFSVSDYAGCRLALSGHGVAPILEVGETFGRAFFVNDPFGNVIEFVEVAGGAE